MFCIKLKFVQSTQELTETEPKLWTDKTCQTHQWLKVASQLPIYVSIDMAVKSLGTSMDGWGWLSHLPWRDSQGFFLPASAVLFAMQMPELLMQQSLHCCHSQWDVLSKPKLVRVCFPPLNWKTQKLRPDSWVAQGQVRREWGRHLEHHCFRHHSPGQSTHKPEAEARCPDSAVGMVTAGREVAENRG